MELNDSDGFWSSKNILITGSTGFVGSWLTRRLVQEKANVVSLVRDDHKKSSLDLICGSDYYPDTVVFGDICNYELISRILSEYNINIIMHLAAQAIVGAANNYPLSTFQSNIQGTWNVLEACRNSPSVESIVIASSDKSYGEPQNVPITEDHPLMASHPYDASKACAEILSKTYAKSFDLPVGITKCSNIYGGGDLNFNRIIPETIQAVLSNNDPIIRSDGTPVRDFIYIDDVVIGYLTLAKAIVKNKNFNGESFNFGTKTPTTVLDLVNRIIEMTGNKKLKPKVQNITKNEIHEQYLDSTKSGKHLGWSAVVDLNEGLAMTVKWYKNYFQEKGIIKN